MKLYYFKRAEFQRGDKNWLNECSPRLLILLDTVRHIYGNPIHISPHPKAIGRSDGASQHNVKKWGEVRAVDIMPEGITTFEDASMFYQIAKSIGFTGIGFYPHWFWGDKTMPGFHLDVRHNVPPGNPANWGGIRTENGQEYVSIDKALDSI